MLSMVRIDFSTVFGLLDSSYKTYNNESSGCKVRFFDKNIEDAPKFTGLGDVVLLRGVRRSAHPSSVLMKHFNTQIVIFPAAVLAQCTAGKSNQTKIDLDRVLVSKRSAKPNDLEQAYAKYLYGWKTANLTQPDPTSAAHIMPVSTITMKDKFTLLRDARDKSFIDIMGEVVKIWPGNPASLYITDFTENKDFYPYKKGDAQPSGIDGDPFGHIPTGKPWQGPPGKYTITISLWHPHSTWASQSANLRAGDTVFVRNVHMKTSLQTGTLEGKLHEDKMRPDEVDIRKIHNFNDERFLNFWSRKTAFEGTQNLKRGDTSPQKSPQKKSKSALKREKRRKKANEEREKPELAETGIVGKSTSNKYGRYYFLTLN